MAPLPVIADTYRVAFNWVQSGLGLGATNVMHFRKSGTNPAALAAILDGDVAAAMWSCQGTNSKIHSLQITPLDGSSVSFPFDTGSPAKWSGTDANNAPVPNVSNIIKLLTAKRGRSYRGRVYLPWVDEDRQGAGKVDAGTLPTLQAAWVAFNAAVTADGYEWVVASYTHATAEPVVAVLAETYIATQRRRQVRVSNI